MTAKKEKTTKIKNKKITKDTIIEINQLTMIFNIFTISALILAIGLTFVSYFTTGIGQMIIIVLALLMYIAFFVGNIIKIKKLKNK